MRLTLKRGYLCIPRMTTTKTDILGIGEVEPLDLGTRRHHRADAAIAETKRHLHDRRLLEQSGQGRKA
jgi:hypothetical protein